MAVIPNGHKMYQHLPLQDPPKLTQTGSFGFKMFHLAALDLGPLKRFFQNCDGFLRPVETGSTG
jgi:hypothetical protein